MPKPVQPLIVVLSVSAGNGHVRAADALRSAGKAAGDVAMLHLDAMQFAPVLFRKIYTGLYRTLVQSFPALWLLLYRHTDRAHANSAGHLLRRLLERTCTTRLRRRLGQLAPDAIICTHFLPAEMLARLPLRQLPRGGIWIQVTDYDLHRMWVHPGVAGYFVASQQIAWRLRQAGIDAQRIHVTGIPVAPAFAMPRGRVAAAARLAIDPLRPTLLLMSGGHGHGGLLRLAAELVNLERPPQLLVVAGSNVALQRALDTLAAGHPGRLRVFGYCRQIEQLMACADIVISKPGGLTSAECMALGVPMILVDCIPGQEERNAKFLSEAGAALRADDAQAVCDRVRQLLDDPARLASMRGSARTIGRPDAAPHALRIVRDALANK